MCPDRLNEAHTHEEAQIWEMILTLPFYEVNGEGEIGGLKMLTYLEIAKSQNMDPDVSLELLKSAHLGVMVANQKKDPQNVL